MSKTDKSAARPDGNDQVPADAAVHRQDDVHGRPGGRGASPSRVEFNYLESETGAAPRQEMNIDLVLDIPVTMTMEVGGTRLSIRNLLQLGRGSVVELDRLAGESMDIKVNGVLIGHGEVVVVNEKFGIRLTSVVRPAAWIEKLK